MAAKRDSKRRKTRRTYGHGYTPEFRKRVVREVVEDGTSASEVADVFGVSREAVYNWVKAFKAHGESALDTKTPGRKAQPKAADVPDTKRDAVVAVKQAFPNFGARKISDSLRRFEALGVSATQVRRILHEEGLLPDKPPELPKMPPPERRFERAEPNQLWQSDIFTFLLRRHQRVYVTAFMDDHSRFVVAHVLSHHQKGSLTCEALERGIASYGTPQEVLTDQGRQYTAWRGETAFEALLKQYGIRHVMSRPQHPQTLGKVERFWKTLWDEFLSRTVFADFADCERRMALFIHAYNFRRPHQALSGLVPADRYFRSAPQVRDAVEKGVSANALRLALEQPTRKPFYLTGRLGDKDVSIAIAEDGLQLQLGDDAPQLIKLTKEDRDETKPQQARFHEASAQAADESTPDAELAARAAGPGRDGAPPHSYGAVGVVGREGSDRRRDGGADFAAAVLPARDEGAARDSAGPGAGSRADGHLGGGRVHQTHHRAGGAGEAAAAGPAPERAAALPHPKDGEEGAAGVGDAGPAAQGEVLIDEAWGRRFDSLDAGEHDDGSRVAFDPEQGWREQPLTWTRKLAGADAPGGAHERRSRAAEEGEERLPGRTDGATGGGATAGSVSGGPNQADVGDRGSEAGGALPQPLPEPDAPWPEWLAQGAGSEARGAPVEAGVRGEAGATGGTAHEGERVPDGAGGDGGPAAGGGERAGAREADAEGPRPADGREKEPGAGG
ncbi:MAG: IS481 family transposase [Archangiaceae bacterium]|nr:IS481 family transposase [Archangiaceae bacterium]